MLEVAAAVDSLLRGLKESAFRLLGQAVYLLSTAGATEGRLAEVLSGDKSDGVIQISSQTGHEKMT